MTLTENVNSGLRLGVIAIGVLGGVSFGEGFVEDLTLGIAGGVLGVIAGNKLIGNDRV